MLRACVIASVWLTACGNPRLELPADGEPRCTVTDDAVRCAPQSTKVDGREVYWQSPSSVAPTAGYPVVLVFQGSFFPPSLTWNEVPRDTSFGGYQQARMQALLLERGFIVIAPFADGIAWQTNTSFDFANSGDKKFIDALLVEIGNGTFGAADVTRLYATGISSGGYMTSRMALTWPGTFRALSISSASWATCGGAACVLPDTLPAGHPPTQFLHGGGDVTVPLFTAQAYVDALTAQGFEAELIIDDELGHAWLPEAPERVVDWFTAH